MILSFVALGGCGANPAPTATNDTSTNTTVAVVPPTQPPPATATAVPSNGLGGEAVVADNFDTVAGIEPTYLNKVADVSPDAVGAFRLTCSPGQLLKDDPLFYPGQPGVSHLHQFAGNTQTSAGSTYQSLRTTGGTTCGSSATPINRSGYWFPAMLDGAGNVVKPDYFNVYYKQLPASDPNCALRATACVPLPNGIRYIYGYNMQTMSGGPNDPNSWDHDFFFFECWTNDDTSQRAVDGRWQTIAAAAAAGCPAGSLLIAQTTAPECWDGKNVDSADHRSHVSYATGPGVGVGAGAGRKCPDGYPYLIPSMQVRFVFTTDANFTAGRWHLSSDEMMPNLPAGSTLHVDYWEAWSPTVKALWQANCIDAHRTCSNGDLGNATQIKGIGAPAGGWVRHQLVPLSSI